ncbi:MAG: 3-deoxy-D-manno-octulosonic acid transferase [Deltaproteobacteria bacterium]|uniref:3-deoxy-D-manno-octulosonic acid transferase n=1 Tax=Desulfobacula sp. TaxID=2593537 RepID=UPI0019C387A3|nr:3-deoxy-D-manno-octulosonic acid transferase [Candidatus Desulfobacula maris]MBL6993249.1 3-deoxy-D-manno-octulosonic acid transferase [Desulfobacula sp.]
MIKNAFILNFFKLYNMLWRLSIPFLKKNKRLRSGFEKRIDSFHHTKADIWIQAASAGEAFLAANILKRLSPKTYLKILVTTTTAQGMDILQTRLTKKMIHKSIDLKIEWFPFDMPDTIEKTIKIINPRVMVLLETEIWPALLYYLKLNKTRIFIINARLSKNSYTHYLKTKFFWKHLSPDTILATSDKDAQRYEQVFEGAMVNTMPNIKFEAIDTDEDDVNTLKQIKKILPQALPLTILASVRKQEEKEMVHILKNILKTVPNQVVAIFPRHIHRVSAWEKRLTSQNLNFHLRSKINSCLKNPCIILWDTFGELKTVYGLASVVFVGGSLKPLGGQNFIEPAIQGAVIVTGPYYDDFAWATNDIFKKGIVIKQNYWKAVARTITQALEKPGSRSDRKRLALEYLQSNQGGTQQACHEILKVFDV